METTTESGKRGASLDRLGKVTRRSGCLCPVLFPLFLCALLVFVSMPCPADAVPTHLDKTKVKNGCSGCHKGHGIKGTALLNKERDNSCFECHGPSGSGGDIYTVLMKQSKHPVIETSRFHITGEELPEKSPLQLRHVSCLDCHNVHKSEKGQAIKGMRGYAGKELKMKRVEREYQLCYECHSDSANLSGPGTNVSLQFAPSNASFHAVETYGRSYRVPSLKGKLTASSLINCSDCHGNDNPRGPKGPHGSIYSPILRYRYNRTVGIESPTSYELCYSCHDRSSILNDESFKSHKAHVAYNQIGCAQCHDAHGSKTYPSLVVFDPAVVFPNSQGSLLYMQGSAGRPRCFLNCHLNAKTYEHRLDNKLRYWVNAKTLSGW